MRKHLFPILALALIPGHAFGVDGVVLINQSTVMAAGGFPYVISQPGSYKLSGNLVVDAGKNGIEISVSNVFFDLNGFDISCGGATGSHRVACISGIAAVHDISIQNGTISENTPSSETFTFNGIYFSNSAGLDPIGERVSGRHDRLDRGEQRRCGSRPWLHPSAQHHPSPLHSRSLHCAGERVQSGLFHAVVHARPK